MHRSPRTGSASAAWLAGTSLVLLAGLVALLAWNSSKSGRSVGPPLTVYCAAGLQQAMAAAARDYEQESGVAVQVQYGGSQTLLANVEVGRRGDLYVPGDETYIQLARSKDLIDEVLPLARMTPVLAVRRGNPKNLRTIDDLQRPDVRLAQANPDAAAVGKLVRSALQKSGQWTEVKKRTVVFKPTVNEVANDVKVGAADAGFLWDATLHQYPELEAVPLPELHDVAAHISASVLRGSTQPTAALRFARYLTARDKGLLHFQESGFQPVEGDVWAENPEVRLLAGAMLRPAIEQTITAFEQREGVRVTRVYNGCGILVAQMKTGPESVPDAYFACDKSFMTQVSDLFLDSVDISSNDLVILVPRDNPFEIKSLGDLGKPGIKLGVGHEKQCALGALTQQTLTQGRLRDPVMANVRVQSPTGDLLVNQLLAGSLDAVIVYVSNVSAAGDKVQAIPIKDIPCAQAVQPMAVARESTQKYLTGRLMEALRSRDSRQRFETLGFHWQEKQSRNAER
jgi:molybdenum ABC transporter molybdate-binding protein